MTLDKARRALSEMKAAAGHDASMLEDIEAFMQGQEPGSATGTPV